MSQASRRSFRRLAARAMASARVRKVSRVAMLFIASFIGVDWARSKFSCMRRTSPRSAINASTMRVNDLYCQRNRHSKTPKNYGGDDVGRKTESRVRGLA